MFTQSLYLLAAMCTFFFVRLGYVRRWDNWFLAGAILLGAYGIYEVTWFLATGTPGDFVSNRTFASGSFTGSWFQTMQLGPFTIQRLKSLTGEPSMYAFTVLPFWIYAIHTRRTLIALFLFATLILSTSTTALVGVVVYLLLRLWFLRGNDKLALLLLVAAVLAITVIVFAGIQGNPLVEEAYRTLVGEKLSAQSASGSNRWAAFNRSVDFFANLPVANQLFGVGFGYIRSTDMFSTLLVNSGVLGLLLLWAAFFYPVFKLDNSYRSVGLKCCVLVVLVTAMISVPEFSYLPIWLFLGLAYHAVDAVELERARAEPAISAYGRRPPVSQAAIQ